MLAAISKLMASNAECSSDIEAMITIGYSIIHQRIGMVYLYERAKNN